MSERKYNSHHCGMYTCKENQSYHKPGMLCHAPFPRMRIVCTMCKVVNGNVYAKVPIVGFFFFLFLRPMVLLVVVFIRLDGDLACGQ